MFGPYEVEIQGRRYYGNVSLRESHVFDYAGNTYLLDVDRVSARPVSPGLAAVIEHLGVDRGALVPDRVVEALRGLGLVAGEEDAPTLAEPAREPEPARAKPEFAVAGIALFLAQECNMRCVYCYGNAGEYDGGGVMNEDTARRAVDWLVENSGSIGKLSIDFFGGEPLLNYPLMRTIMPYARRKAKDAGKDMLFGMTTNGSLLTDESIASIREENIQTIISFDGPPDVQNRQRPFKDGSGSYDRVAANVAKLREAVPRLTCRATLWGEADPVRIKKSLEKLGFTTCYLTQASPVLLDGPTARATGTGDGAGVAEAMMAVHRQEIEDLLVAIRQRKVDRGCLPAPLSAMTSLIKGQKRHHGCGIGKGVAAVAANGDIYPCHRFVGLPEMRMGNIADYRAGTMNDYHRAIADSLPECRACWARYLCGGGCFYHNKASTGDMHRPSARGCEERRSLWEGRLHVYCRLDDADMAYVRGLLGDSPPEGGRP